MKIRRLTDAIGRVWHVPTDDDLDVPDVVEVTEDVVIRYRQGTKLGRTLYAQLGDRPELHDPLLGVLETRELAEHIVELLNLPLDDGATRALRSARTLWRCPTPGCDRTACTEGDPNLLDPPRCFECRPGDIAGAVSGIRMERTHDHA